MWCDAFDVPFWSRSAADMRPIEGWLAGFRDIDTESMSVPEMNSMEVLGQIGSGESGRVFAAKDDEGRVFAVKVFEGMAINRGVLSKMSARLENGGWPEGVVPLESADFEGKPACVILPLLAEKEGEGEDAKWHPRSLQHRIDEHPGEDTWNLVKEIARALDAMHRKRVVHGNLKPGNVFFDEEGDAKLGDWALGNMPGINHFDFSDALLYQPPEQLVNPAGYFEEEGYRWDVFAFGVLAFRLLTGYFPRCDKNFSSVAPPMGETSVEGIHADALKISKNLLSQPEVSWTTEPRNELEKGYRKWIDQCLLLEPASRPVSMIEVSAGFSAVDAAVEAEAVRETMMDQRRRAERNGRRLAFFGGLVTAACFVLGGLWYLTRKHLENEQFERAGEKVALTTKANDAVEKMNVAVSEKEKAERQMAYDHDLGLARLEASRLIGDRLFEWSMEKGHRSLPPLDGRKLRLKRLERFYEDFLRRNASIQSLDDERSRARLQLAEISLAAGDAEKAEKRLGEAIAGWTGSGIDGQTKLRLGRDALLLALLKQKKGHEGTADAFNEARAALNDVPQAEVDSQRLRQLVAILDFHEANLLAANGDDAKALEQLLNATRTLNELADARPDAAVLRSELAACYLSSATILEGIGKLGDAREVRTLAASEMVRLLKADPGNVDLRLELAGCYGAMAEASILSGDIGAASNISEQTMKLLDEVLQKRPESTVAAVRKAAQLGLQAGLLRDQGKPEEAVAAFEQGIMLLERQGADRNPMVDYRLALLRWQKGRMSGFAGEKDDELDLLGKARDMLRELEVEADQAGPSVEELQRSSAYLLGDYAHALELSDKETEAREAYREAVELWENLSKSRPESEEYSEGLDWIRQRATSMPE